MNTSDRVTDLVGYQLKRAQQALRTAMDEGLRAQGLTTPQYAALTHLEADEPLSGAELARRCFVTAQTMNAILVDPRRPRAGSVGGASAARQSWPSHRGVADNAGPRQSQGRARNGFQD
jgi:hypothetical protein